MVPLTDSVRESIIKMVESGMSTAAIGKVLHGKYTRQQIAAVRAWVTMGSYGKGAKGTLRAIKAPKVRSGLLSLRNRIDRMLKIVA